MRWTAAVAAMATLMVAGGAHAAPSANPLLGEWQDEQPPRAGLLSYRHLQFGPEAMILDRAQSVAVLGYDIDGPAVRVRTAGGGDLRFILADARLCLAQAHGLHPLRVEPRATAGERCFVRRAPDT